ncbi:RILP-like protein 1 [Gouania willdenowi]|uniref:RILP-like protein 1 n=1 Tax=Gouania willdenowi TaxID=441366 RepID=A0A8C5E500_GOUWI|nr:RILP-like protein 1 [Gouania willdenowi]
MDKALDRPAAELTVMDVYDIASALGQEFERVIDRYDCEALVGVVPRVVRVLELLEALVSRGTAGQEVEGLRAEVDRLRRERNDRYEQERKHQEELELVEDVWKGEVQDLLSQISQLQAENQRLLVNLALKESPITEEDLQKQQGMSEKERQVMKKLKDLVDKQRDEIRAKDRQLRVRNDDVEALQMQQHRLMRMNQDLLHRAGVMEAQAKTLTRQKAELEATAQALHQELSSLQTEVSALRNELREMELEREVGEMTRFHVSSSPASPSLTPTAASTSTCLKPKSVWAECEEDPDFLKTCFERDKSLLILPQTVSGERVEEEEDEEEETTALSQKVPPAADPEEEMDDAEEESNHARFTLEELRDVLQERNDLKAQLFLLQEELLYYKSEDYEDSIVSSVCTPPPPSAPLHQSESGIKRLIFTAVMPMVAAGLLADDPTLLPIRRLVSFV